MIKITIKPDSEIMSDAKDYVKFLRIKPEVVRETIMKFRKEGEVSGILYDLQNREIGTWELIH